MMKPIVLSILAFLVHSQLCSALKEAILKNAMSCSRSESKFIREYFARALLPIYHKYSLPVPEQCPFSPLHDIYHFQENNKTKLDTYRWKCEICGKHFLSEKHIDKHFEKKHMESLQNSTSSLCLANHCRLFRCDFLMNPNSGPKKCYESTMINLKNRCKHFLEMCIPNGISADTRNKLTVELRDNLCSYLTCKKYYELPAYMSSGPSFLTIFFVVMCIGLSIIAYGVINHTDLIFDENEQLEPIAEEDENESETTSISSSSSNRANRNNSNNKPNYDKLYNQINVNDSHLRHRANTNTFIKRSNIIK